MSNYAPKRSLKSESVFLRKFSFPISNFEKYKNNNPTTLLPSGKTITNFLYFMCKMKKKLLLRVKVFMLFQCCALYPKICSYFVWCSMLHNDAGKLRRNIDKTFFLFLCARSPLGCVVSLYQWLISAISGLKEVPEFLLRTFSKYLAFTPGKILFRVSMTSCDAAIFLSLKKITSVSIYYAMNERSYIFS